MEILQEVRDVNKKSFLGHVFSTTEDGKAEILNVVQYSIMGVVPVIVLNKLIQRFIPEADPDKSSLEITVEVLIQLIVMFCGIVVIHRLITYFPTYSGFKYEGLALTNVILAFLILVLSIQTKLGIKVNLLVDRLSELWNGPSGNESKSGSAAKSRPNVRVSQGISQHAPSQADFLDNGHSQMDMFPPAPVATSKPPAGGDSMIRGMPDMGMSFGPAPANGVLGGSFGSFF
jgi:hypothetical protein